MRYMDPRQRGMTLVIVLILLVVMTLLVVSAVNTSTTNLKIINNTQSTEISETRAQDAVAQVIQSVSNFKPGGATAPGDRYISLDTAGKVVVSASAFAKDIGKVDKPVCIWTGPAEGFSAADPLTPEDTVWDIKASVTDKNTDTVVEIHQGVGIRLLAGNCN